MEVIIDGIVYAPKENKSELEKIEQKYDSGEYIIIERLPDHCMQVDWNICSSRSYLKYCEKGKYAKLIHKKHKHILEAYLKDNNVGIEIFKNQTIGYINIENDFILAYNEDKHYRLKQKQWYENTDNFPCILINLKTNKPHIAYSYNDIENKLKMETFSSSPNKFRLATNQEIDNLKINK